VTPEQIALVSQSVAAMGPSKEDLASEFYRQLLALDPTLRNLLAEDRQAQEAQFTKWLTEIVDSMTNFDGLVALTRGLGQYLAGHGVRVSHYPTGRAALMAALEDMLGARFDPATREAWTLASNLVAECMMAGASQR
jgi:hemoglobin-like flavoprotein